MTGPATGLAIPEPDPEAYASATRLAERAREPAALGNIALGTAGWTDKTLVKGGLFYPRGVSNSEARLRHYAAHFSLVEVDATYYTLLPPSVAENWVVWTPPTFVFDVKAHPVVTGHPIDIERLPKELAAELAHAGHTGRVYPDRMPAAIADEISARFSALLDPLVRAGRLGCVMAQFPPWFSATRGNARRIEALRARWPDVPFSIELRNKTWFEPGRRERLFELLRAHELAYVCVDEPEVEHGGVPPVSAVTSDKLALVRFHGHNRAGWSKRGASVHERFDYLYAEAELAAWVAPVRALAEKAERVHAIFNNCVRNYAVLGAKGLSVLLEAEPSPDGER